MRLQLGMADSLSLMLILSTPGICLANLVTPACPEHVPVCEFVLELRHHLTMVHFSDEQPQTAAPLVRGDNTSWFVRDPVHCDQYSRAKREDVTSSTTADGSYRSAFLYNGSLPGPPIIVYKGQQVVVRLKNNLVNEVTTIHFHGILQRNTPWMDGAGGVSQCPINPGESFTYRFLADETGTYWYHSHIESQRTMGAHGPMIVLDRTHQETNLARPADPLPEFDAEFYIMASDWFNKSSLDLALLVQGEAVSYMQVFDSKDIYYEITKMRDGNNAGVAIFYSMLFNGKGYRYNKFTDALETPGLPLEVFTVRQGGKYRFRAISAAMAYKVSLSIDGHPLNLIATDGSDVQTRQVDSVIVSSGERYDFWIEASDPLNLGNYWIRGENLERTQLGEPVHPGHMEAILRYEGAPAQDPSSAARTCTPQAPCKVLNCPYSARTVFIRQESDVYRRQILTYKDSPSTERVYFLITYLAPNVMIGPTIASFVADAILGDSGRENVDCIPVTVLRSTQPLPTIKADDVETWQETFLNFHYVSETTSLQRPVINNYRHKPPVVPPQTYPDPPQLTACDNSTLHGPVYFCTHVHKVPRGAMVQMVISVTFKPTGAKDSGDAHMFHLHGYKFQVVKMTYPVVDSANPVLRVGKVADLSCESELCLEVGWSDVNWKGGNIPGVISEAAPLKDTLLIPVGGYAVIQFKADNPGFWYIHCHMEYHNFNGMAMYLQVGDEDQMNALPSYMRKCGNFNWSNEQFNDLQQNRVTAEKLADDDEETGDVCTENDSGLTDAAITLSSITLLFLLFSVILYFDYL